MARTLDWSVISVKKEIAGVQIFITKYLKESCGYATMISSVKFFNRKHTRGGIMRLAGLLIKNYRRIGNIECAIRIDKIVVLIGQNNAGKSTVLDAYETFASAGKVLNVSDFHKEDISNPIEITGIFNEITEGDTDVIGGKWVHQDTDYGDCIKVRWVWKQPNEKGLKQSYDAEVGDFVDGGVGGWDSLISSRIPQPVRIKPTESVETTQTKIVGMLKEHIKASLKANSSSTRSAFEEIERLAKTLFDESKTALDSVSLRITDTISKVFPGVTIEVVPRSKDSIDEKLIGAESFLRVGTTGGSETPLALQGTGIQRALLWSALSVMSDSSSSTPKKKPKSSGDAGRILLIDEPEAFLHPPTIRSARESLYDFALNNPEWQVIATTHSPIFIDLSKDHTTIVRVDATSDREHFVSTDKISFDAPERTRLRMVRSCNPMVNEFFFFDRIILVEGPTEHIVIKHVAEKIGQDVHVIDCMGKANIPIFAQILNHFKVPYIVIHDSDTPKCKRKSGVVKNGMWKLNEDIRKVVSESPLSEIYTQFPNFEGAFLGEELKSGKVDNILELLEEGATQEYQTIFEAYKNVLNSSPEIFTTKSESFEQKKDLYLSQNGLVDDWKWQ